MNKKNIFIAFVLLSSINFWSFQGNKYQNVFALLQLILSSFFIIYIAVFRKQPGNMYFKKYVLLFMFLPFLSILPCYAVHDQSLFISTRIMLMQLCWLFYFVLHRFQISEKEILKIFIFIGFIWTFLELVQQFTYPTYFFYNRGDTLERDIEIRGGIYRYMIEGLLFGVLAFFYFLHKFFYSNQQRMKNLFFMIFFLLGIHLYMTRQVTVAVLACVFIAPFFLKINFRKKILFFLGGIILIGSIYIYRDMLFGELIEKTGDQMNEENIRVTSYKFYLNYWDDWSCFVFGNGVPHSNSSYGTYLINYLQKELGLYRSDIGIVGELSKFGIIYIIVFIAFCFYFFRKSKEIKLYLKLYFILIIFNLPMSFPFFEGGDYLIFSVYFYLCDRSIETSKYNTV